MESRKKILIVDDEQDIRAYLSTLFGDQGYETQAAGDGEEARKQMEAGAPDLITLDISMPEKSGIRFYRDMKSRWTVERDTGHHRDRGFGGFQKIHLLQAPGPAAGGLPFQADRPGGDSGDGEEPHPRFQNRILAQLCFAGREARIGMNRCYGRYE